MKTYVCELCGEKIADALDLISLDAKGNAIDENGNALECEDCGGTMKVE